MTNINDNDFSKKNLPPLLVTDSVKCIVESGNYCMIYKINDDSVWDLCLVHKCPESGHLYIEYEDVNNVIHEIPLSLVSSNRIVVLNNKSRSLLHNYKTIDGKLIHKGD